jgi:NH3-dependent NAD+ synthetase
MKPDAQFRQWWEEHLGKDPIPEGYVITVRKALQGHPESPRLWDKYISKMIMEELGFTSAVHDPCLYYKHDDDDNLTLIHQQVDDFLVANKDSKECNRIGALIQEKMTNLLNQLGTI